MDEVLDQTRTYDAVLFGRGFQRGETHRARVDSTCDALEPLLGGGPVHVRDVGGRFLATRSPHDKLLFDHGHPRALQPRYAWAPGPGGLELGTLVEDAR